MSHPRAIPFAVGFDFEVCEAFVKSGGDPDKERRIAGFVTTDKLDQQGEKLVQEGLDFTHFLKKGFFNDNHSRDTAGIVGEPDQVTLVRAGERLPNGRVADKTGHYVEGNLYKGTKRADEIWELANALTKSKRKLGFSVEGTVTKRTVKHGVPHVAAAIVRNVAITNCPVNDDTSLEVLAKSLSMGAPSPGGPAYGVGVPGGGAVLAPESLEGARKKRKKKRGLTKSEGILFIAQRWPHISFATAERIYLHAASKRSA